MFPRAVGRDSVEPGKARGPEHSFSPTLTMSLGRPAPAPSSRMEHSSSSGAGNPGALYGGTRALPKDVLENCRPVNSPRRRPSKMDGKTEGEHEWQPCQSTNPPLSLERGRFQLATNREIQKNHRAEMPTAQPTRIPLHAVLDEKLFVFKGEHSPNTR